MIPGEGKGYPLQYSGLENSMDCIVHPHKTRPDFLYQLCRETAIRVSTSDRKPRSKSLQKCLTVRPHRRQPTRLPHPWDSPDKNTRVGCHFLLQCMKVKRESEVVQLCPTLSDPMDCSLPGSSAHGIFQARVLELGCHSLLTLP